MKTRLRGGATTLFGAGVGTLPAILRKVLDPLARGPLRVVVLERVYELPHELRRGAHAGYDHAGDLIVVDLVVEPREGDRELVVRVADIREVRVGARHRLG